MNIKVSSIFTATQDAKNFATQVVSITNPNGYVPVFDAEHLVVKFYDTDIHTDMFAPQFSDVKKIFDFVRNDANVLVHCDGGISRSTAIGIGLWLRTGKTVDEAVNLVFKDRPILSPNMLVVSHIVNLLGLTTNVVNQIKDAVAILPKDLVLWCDACKEHFIDGQNCKGNHFQ